MVTRRQLIRRHVVGLNLIVLGAIVVGLCVKFGPPLFSSRYIAPQAKLELQVADERIAEFASAARRFAAEHAFSTFGDFSYRYDNGTTIYLDYNRPDGVYLSVAKAAAEPNTFHIAIWAVKPDARWREIFDELQSMLKSDGYIQD